MLFRKEREWLIFINEDGKELRISIKDGVAQKQLRGKWNEIKTDTIQKFFVGISSYTTIQTMIKREPSIGKFLKYVYNIENLCSNMGTFLIRMRDHLNIEQWIALGYEHIEGNHYGASLKSLKYVKPTTFNKNILKMYKNIFNEIMILRSKASDKQGREHHIYSRGISNLYDSMGSSKNLRSKTEEGGWIDVSLKKEYNQMLFWLYEKYGVQYIINNVFLSDNVKDIGVMKILELCHTHNYDYKKLHIYINQHLPYREGFGGTGAIRYLVDYIYISEDLKLKYDRYPKNLKVKHDVVVRTRNELDYEYCDRYISDFKERVNHKLGYHNKEYFFMFPSDPLDVVRDGRTLHHCSGSYVDLIGPYLQIIFMRSSIDVPEITLCIEDGAITQARGSYHVLPNADQAKAIEQYAKAKSLKIKIEVD